MEDVKNSPVEEKGTVLFAQVLSRNTASIKSDKGTFKSKEEFLLIDDYYQSFGPDQKTIIKV